MGDSYLIQKPHELKIEEQWNISRLHVTYRKTKPLQFWVNVKNKIYKVLKVTSSKISYFFDIFSGFSWWKSNLGRCVCWPSSNGEKNNCSSSPSKKNQTTDNSRHRELQFQQQDELAKGLHVCKTSKSIRVKPIWPYRSNTGTPFPVHIDTYNDTDISVWLQSNQYWFL